MTQEKDNFFSDENEAKANWFKFEKIGDAVKGTLVGRSVKPARDVFPEQEVYELKQEDGSTVNVASSKNYVRNIMRRVKYGQIVGFRYDSDYQTDANKKKGMAPAKTIKVYVGAMDPDYDIMNKMVEQAGIEVNDVDFN